MNQIKKEFLMNFNDTASEYSRGKTVVELFEEQLKKTSDKTAVGYDGN